MRILPGDSREPASEGVGVTGKFYYEANNVPYAHVDMSSGSSCFFKNPVMIHMSLSSGDFLAKVSTPLTEADLIEISDTLRHACEELRGN